jgi:hypothetical protein
MYGSFTVLDVKTVANQLPHRIIRATLNTHLTLTAEGFCQHAR